MIKKKALLLSRKGCNYSKLLEKNLFDFGFELLTHQSSNFRGKKLPENILKWKGDYIFSFRSLYIVPSSLISSASIASINFHPGPPDYPGGGCTNFALLDKAEVYGVTAHLMNEKIDNGKILSVSYFPISPQDNINSLTTKTHKELYILAKNVIKKIMLNGLSSFNYLDSDKEIKWRKWKGSIKQIDELSTLDFEHSRSDMLKIIRAVHTPEFPAKIIINGLEFHFYRDILE